MEISSDTEQKILQAASEVFLEKGHAGARMQEIADKAGINKALLHYYFRSKDRLFRTVFRMEMHMVLRNIFSPRAEADTFKDFLKNFIKSYMQNSSTRKKIMRFILWEMEKSSEDLVNIFYNVFESYGYKENPLVMRIRTAIDNGEIRPVDPANFALSLLGACIFPFVAAPILKHLIPEVNLEDPAFIDRRIKEIHGLIWEGIEPLKSSE